MSIDLDEMKSVWKSGTSSAPDAKVIEIMIRQTRKRVRWTWLLVIIELVMVAGLVAVLGHMIFVSSSLTAQAIFAGFAITLIAIEMLMLKERRGLWRSSATSPREHAEFQTRQALFNVKFAKLGAISAPAGIIAGYIAMAFHTDTSLIDVLKIIAAVTAIIVSWIFSRYWIARRKAELQECQRIEGELA